MGMPSLKNDPLRLCVESRIARFITELVTDGVSNFYPKLTALASEWSSIFQSPSVCSFPSHVSETHSWVSVSGDHSNELSSACTFMRELVQGDAQREVTPGWVQKILHKAAEAYRSKAAETVDAEDAETQALPSHQQEGLSQNVDQERENVDHERENVDQGRQDIDQEREDVDQERQNIDHEKRNIEHERENLPIAKPRSSKRLREQQTVNLPQSIPSAPPKKRRRRGNGSATKNTNRGIDALPELLVEHNGGSHVSIGMTGTEKQPIMRKYSAKDPQNNVRYVSCFFSVLTLSMTIETSQFRKSRTSSLFRCL